MAVYQQFDPVIVQGPAGIDVHAVVQMVMVAPGVYTVSTSAGYVRAYNSAEFEPGQFVPEPAARYNIIGLDPAVGRGQPG